MRTVIVALSIVMACSGIGATQQTAFRSGAGICLASPSGDTQRDAATGCPLQVDAAGFSALDAVDAPSGPHRWDFSAVATTTARRSRNSACCFVLEPSRLGQIPCRLHPPRRHRVSLLIGKLQTAYACDHPQRISAAMAPNSSAAPAEQAIRMRPSLRAACAASTPARVSAESG